MVRASKMVPSMGCGPLGGRLTIHREKDAGEGAGSERGRCGQCLDKLSSRCLRDIAQALGRDTEIWELSWAG